MRKNTGDRYCYRVRDLEHLSTIILPFFMKHSLKTKKNIEFQKFRKIIDKMILKEHLTPQGINRINALLQSMNNRGKRREPLTVSNHQVKDLI